MRRPREASTPEVRLLLGRELLAFTGWSRDDFLGGCTDLANEVLSSLAGNAFSAFASGPVLAAALHVMHEAAPRSLDCLAEKKATQELSEAEGQGQSEDPDCGSQDSSSD